MNEKREDAILDTVRKTNILSTFKTYILMLATFSHKNK